MNIENIRKTRDRIAAQPEFYDQTKWTHGCGTPSCIAGFAVVACGGRLEHDEKNEDVLAAYDEAGEQWFVSSLARKYLGINYDETTSMFFAFPLGAKAAATSSQATAMLDRFIETGEVEWRATE